ncbi:MAG: Foldase protein PrsA 3 [Verrucomicrobia subdivision 3 bacterium]|nr:Foldase protein PrsA 3 [Limisphaerales bacterium]MCS1413512.1 Foldase protein PrsA 3 [Limisphaerales bacterium]
MTLTVNGEPVDPELINQEFSQIKSWHEQRSQVSCCERDDEFLAQAKENIIGRVLLNQKAQSSIPDLSEAEISQAVEQLKKDYGGEAQLFAQAGVGPAQMDLVRQQVAANSKVDKLVRQICETKTPPSDNAIRKHYDENIELYTTEARVKAMHIYKSLRQTEDKEALFTECCKVRQELVDGADFAAVAKRFSDKPEEEVDLDWFKRGELMDEFEFVTFSMKVGEISPVFASYHGFHIAKVTNKEPATPQPFEEMKDKVLEDLQHGQQNQDIKAYITELRRNATVEETNDDEEANHQT